jgi:nitrogen fixation NifU-like protein
MYSDRVKEHFVNPCNVGELSDANGIGEVVNPESGDMMTIYLRVTDECIKEIKFKTFGCAAAIAVGSVVTEMVKGRALEHAKKITQDDVIETLGGLPKSKIHCSWLGVNALHRAITDYLDR